MNENENNLSDVKQNNDVIDYMFQVYFEFVKKKIILF